MKTKLKAAFENAGFTVHHIEIDRYRNYTVYLDNSNKARQVALRKMQLTVKSDGWGSTWGGYISVRPTQAFERWYAANIQEHA